MIKTVCYKCLHKEICSIQYDYGMAVESVANVSYEKRNGVVELIKDCSIEFIAKCPHFLERNHNYNESTKDN